MSLLIIERKINNNVVYASDGSKKMIVMGKGLGFNAVKGKKIDEAAVEKIFLPAEDLNFSEIEKFADNISIEDIALSEAIISIGSKVLNKKINPKFLIPLIDHINFAIKRQEENMNIISPIEWEIKKFYPDEFKIGKLALELIKKKRGADLPESEAAFIALHFVNAQFDKETLAATIEFTEIINSVLQIVKYFLQVEIDEESFIYNRFLTHLRYYLMRRKIGEFVEVHNQDLLDTVLARFPKELECANKIADFLLKKYGWETPAEEKMYLTLHISCLYSRTKKDA